MADIELALGPCFFNWPAERLRDFYARVADEMPVERVYLGEVVCGKRQPFNDAVWPVARDRLERAGKTVVASLLALPTTPRERRLMREMAASVETIEINDMGALADRGGRPFVAGPLLNVYNETALALLQEYGCVGWCPPVEVPLTEVATIAHAVPEVETELFAFGRLPLAVSARCYNARAVGRAKDSCQYVCGEHADGMGVRTLDDQDFFAVNGIQTLSHAVHVAAVAPERLQAAGVRRLRLSPHTTDLVAVAQAFRALLDGASEPSELLATLESLDLPGAPCNGYVEGERGVARLAV